MRVYTEIEMTGEIAIERNFVIWNGLKICID